MSTRREEEPVDAERQVETRTPTDLGLMAALHCGSSRETGATGTRRGGPGQKLALGGGTQVQKQCRSGQNVEVESGQDRPGGAVSMWSEGHHMGELLVVPGLLRLKVLTSPR